MPMILNSLWVNFSRCICPNFWYQVIFCKLSNHFLIYLHLLYRSACSLEVCLFRKTRKFWKTTVLTLWLELLVESWRWLGQRSWTWSIWNTSFLMNVIRCWNYLVSFISTTFLCSLVCWGYLSHFYCLQIWGKMFRRFSAVLHTASKWWCSAPPWARIFDLSARSSCKT